MDKITILSSSPSSFIQPATVVTPGEGQSSNLDFTSNPIQNSELTPCNDSCTQSTPADATINNDNCKEGTTTDHLSYKEDLAADYLNCVEDRAADHLNGKEDTAADHLNGKENTTADYLYGKEDTTADYLNCVEDTAVDHLNGKDTAVDHLNSLEYSTTKHFNYKPSTNTDQHMCGVCTKKVSTRKKALLCDGPCLRWFHMSCTSFDPSLYFKRRRAMNKCKLDKCAYLKWFCITCSTNIEIMKQDEDPSLSDLPTSAKAISPAPNSNFPIQKDQKIIQLSVEQWANLESRVANLESELLIIKKERLLLPSCSGSTQQVVPNTGSYCNPEKLDICDNLNIRVLGLSELVKVGTKNKNKVPLAVQEATMVLQNFGLGFGSMVNAYRVNELTTEVQPRHLVIILKRKVDKINILKSQQQVLSNKNFIIVDDFMFTPIPTNIPKKIPKKVQKKNVKKRKLMNAEENQKKDSEEGLADFIKATHKSLREKFQEGKEDPEVLWSKHKEDEDNLQKYAETMHTLATEHWDANKNNVSRIKWMHIVVNNYFKNVEARVDKEYRKVNHIRKDDLPIFTRIRNSLETYDSSRRLKVLDVGSCYNPFGQFEDWDVTPIDLCPAKPDVYKCDFLSLKIKSENQTDINDAEPTPRDAIQESNISADAEPNQAEGEAGVVPEAADQVAEMAPVDPASIEVVGLECEGNKRKREDAAPALTHEAKRVKLMSEEDREKIAEITELPEGSFDLVIFSLFLEYIPCPKLRYKCCVKAYELLKPNGILGIITPDSKHEGANNYMFQLWKITLARLGFQRVTYKKFSHFHGMLFRKAMTTAVWKNDAARELEELKGKAESKMYEGIDYDSVGDSVFTIQEMRSLKAK